MINISPEQQERNLCYVYEFIALLLISLIIYCVDKQKRKPRYKVDYYIDGEQMLLWYGIYKRKCIFYEHTGFYYVTRIDAEKHCQELNNK